MAFGFSRTGQLYGSEEYLNGAVDVVVNGNYAYVISKDSDAVVAIDISTKSSPVRVGQITGAGNYLNFVRSCASIVDGNYIYVVSKDSDSFVIIDISTPSNPIRIGQLYGSGEYLGEANSVAVEGNYAYVTGNSSESLVVIDISTKSSPVRVGQITGAGNYLDSPRGVAVNGDYVYVACDTQNSLAIFDVSTKSSPSKVGQIFTGSGGYLDGARGICFDESKDYVLVCAFDSDNLTIIDVTTPSSPSHTGHINNNTGGAIGVYVKGIYAYVACQSGDRLTAINIRDKSNPIFAGTISGAGNYLDAAQGIFVDDNYYAYVASGISDAFVVIEITPDSAYTPSNLAVTSDIEENELTWDEELSADTYNLYWMKYEFFADDFSVDLSGWDIYKDTGTETVQISSEKLYGSNTVGTDWHIVNKNNLPSGNFDIQIDLVTYTPDNNNNGLHAVFRVLDEYPFISDDGAEIYYYVSNSGTQFNIVSNLWINGSNYNTPITIASQPSKFRITRVGTTISVYYYIDSWVQVDSRDFSSYAANLLLVTIDGVQNSGNGGVLEFDNFDYYVDVKTLGTKIADVTSPYNHTSLDEEDNYIYVLTGENPGGESDPTEIVNGVPLSPPYLPPTGITVEKDEGYNTITFTVNPSADYTHIYWGNSPGVTKETGTKISEVTSPYIHDDLDPDPTYYYILTSENIYGEGPPSSEYNDSPFPKPPTGIDADAGVEKNTIYWTESLGADSYNIYWKDSPGVTKLNGTKITGATSPYIHLGLEASVPIYYVVTAEDEDGESSVSEEVYSIPFSPVGPEIPQEPVDQYTILSTFSENDYNNISKLNYSTIGTPPISGYNKIAGDLYDMYEDLELYNCKTDNSFDLEEVSSKSIKVTTGRCIIGGVCIDIKEDKILNIDDANSYFSWANVITGAGTLYVLVYYDYLYNPSISDRKAYVGLMEKTDYNSLTTDEKEYYCFLGAIKVNSSVEVVSPLYYWDPDDTSQDRPHPKGFADGGWLDLPDEFIY